MPVLAEELLFPESAQNGQFWPKCKGSAHLPKLEILMAELRKAEKYLSDFSLIGMDGCRIYPSFFQYQKLHEQTPVSWEKPFFSQECSKWPILVKIQREELFVWAVDSRISSTSVQDCKWLVQCQNLLNAKKYLICYKHEIPVCNSGVIGNDYCACVISDRLLILFFCGLE